MGHIAAGSSCPAVVERIAVDTPLVVDTRLVADSQAAAAGMVRCMDSRVGKREEGRWVLRRHCVLALALPAVLDCVCDAEKKEGDPSWQRPLFAIG